METIKCTVCGELLVPGIFHGKEVWLHVTPKDHPPQWK